MEYLEVITEPTRQNCCAVLSFPEGFKINYRYPWARSTEAIFTCVLNDSTINTDMAPRQICSHICRVEFQKLLNADGNVDNVFFMFCLPCIVVQFWVNDQLDAQLRYMKRLLL
jgi:hypothetical protein